MDEQLADAVRSENYELAAELRDQLRHNEVSTGPSSRPRKARGDSDADLSRN
ncbi:MAG: UvrB/UvrC motif-containing protein [Pirellulales bacterium]